MEWIPKWGSLWIAFSSVSAPHFVSVFAPMSILFPLLRGTEAYTLWSSFILSFMWSENCILGIPSFWANIHLPVSAYHVCSFVIGLPHSGYFLVSSICLRADHMKLKKKEVQSVGTLVLLGKGNKILMGANTETKCGAETEGKAIQRLPHLGINPIYSHQIETLLCMLTGARYSCFLRDSARA